MKKQELKKSLAKETIKEEPSNTFPPEGKPSLPVPSKHALDLNLILGDDASGEDLARMVVNFQLKPEKIEQLCTNADLDFASVGNDTMLRFDFVTQEGREKEAIQYFQNGLDRYPRDGFDPNLSPLQNWFTRPTHEGKLELFESKRLDGKKGVTLLYRLYTSEMADLEDLHDFTKKLEEAAFHPDARLEMELRGHLDTYKKNRIRVRMDYIRAHLFSKEFTLAQLLELMRILEAFGDEEETVNAVINNPAFKLLQKSEAVQGTVRMGSMRKMLQLYKIGIESNLKDRAERESPEIIKGLFKGEVRFTFVFESKLGVAANFSYESESILIRLLSGLKKYAELFD